MQKIESTNKNGIILIIMIILTKSQPAVINRSE